MNLGTRIILILRTKIKRPQSLSLPYVLSLDFTCEPCRLISLLANEYGALSCLTSPGTAEGVRPRCPGLREGRSPNLALDSGVGRQMTKVGVRVV